jgi:hypothetical protein
MEINLQNLQLTQKSKLFFILLCNNSILNFNIELCNIPFGLESYLNKNIINIELLNTNNIHHNIISKIQSLENSISSQSYISEINVKQNLSNKTFSKSLKESKLGFILRTHPKTNIETYIKKKDLTKMFIDINNIGNTTSNIEVFVKGVWMNDTSYGLYWGINYIQIVKFNS